MSFPRRFWRLGARHSLCGVCGSSESIGFNDTFLNCGLYNCITKNPYYLQVDYSGPLGSGTTFINNGSGIIISYGQRPAWLPTGHTYNICGTFSVYNPFTNYNIGDIIPIESEVSVYGAVAEFEHDNDGTRNMSIIFSGILTSFYTTLEVVDKSAHNVYTFTSTSYGGGQYGESYSNYTWYDSYYTGIPECEKPTEYRVDYLGNPWKVMSYRIEDISCDDVPTSGTIVFGPPYTGAYCLNSAPASMTITIIEGVLP